MPILSISAAYVLIRIIHRVEIYPYLVVVHKTMSSRSRAIATSVNFRKIEAMRGNSQSAFFECKVPYYDTYFVRKRRKLQRFIQNNICWGRHGALIVQNREFGMTESLDLLRLWQFDNRPVSLRVLFTGWLNTRKFDAIDEKLMNRSRELMFGAG